MSDLVSSGCGYIDFHGTVKKLGYEKVSNMIENGILYLRPTSVSMGHVVVPPRNLLVATGAPALRAMELLLQDPKYMYLKRRSGFFQRMKAFFRRIIAL
jgi:hypothetical protein